MPGYWTILSRYEPASEDALHLSAISTSTHNAMRRRQKQAVSFSVIDYILTYLLKTNNPTEREPYTKQPKKLNEALMMVKEDHYETEITETKTWHSSGLPPVVPRLWSWPVEAPGGRRYGSWGNPRRVGPSQAHRMQRYRRRGAYMEMLHELPPRSLGVRVLVL